MNDKTKPIARRQTANGKAVCFWANGDVTWALGYAIRGVGSAMSSYAQARNLEASHWIMDDVGLYDSAEIPALIKCAREMARQSGWETASPADRRVMFNRAISRHLLISP